MLARIVKILEEKHCGHLELGISPHSPYNLSQAYLQELFDVARRRGVALTTHLAESPEENTFLGEARGPLAELLYSLVGWSDMLPPAPGGTPASYLEACGGLVPSNLLAHGVQVTADDAGRLARAGATVALCPRSNARLGVGRAPVDLYRAAGVPLVLGTDSLASCASLSIWDEIAFACTWFEGRLSPRELLDMATREGARALGVEREMGRLETGVGGSFQVLIPAALPPLGEVEDFLCTPGRTDEVAALYLAGREVLQKGGRDSIIPA
jgi:cytosine/adenosine deaminase-related metal-dependent hydrolase